MGINEDMVRSYSHIRSGAITKRIFNMQFRRRAMGELRVSIHTSTNDFLRNQDTKSIAQFQ